MFHQQGLHSAPGAKEAATSAMVQTTEHPSSSLTGQSVLPYTPRGDSNSSWPPRADRSCCLASAHAFCTQMFHPLWKIQFSTRILMVLQIRNKTHLSKACWTSSKSPKTQQFELMVLVSSKEPNRQCQVQI